MKILLIDDDEAILTLFSTVLQKDNHQIVTANTGQGGLEKAKNEKPELILLDQVLPDIQGNEVLKTLKEDLDTKEIPVAILSNFGQNELIQEAINSGAADYILKYQIEPQDLANKVKELRKDASNATTQAGQG
ncbi:MAG: response regulator [Candidatus Levybacteria bacterium]|nr:response regulator [Candidatus Levybacteria bacterium]